MPLPIPILASVLNSLVELVPVRDQGRYFCTGVRIHAEWILTSAHCVDKIDTLEIKPYGSSAKPLVVTPKQITIDENYFSDCSFHDLALIHLKDPHQHAFVKLDEVEKFSAGVNPETLRLGVSLVNGKAELVKKPVHWVDNQMNFDPLAKNKYAKENLQMILFQNDETRVGHSGGPLIEIDKGKPKLLAIHSGTKGGVKGDDYAYAATIYNHLDWIHGVMKKHGAVSGVAPAGGASASIGAVAATQKVCPTPPMHEADLPSTNPQSTPIAHP